MCVRVWIISQRGLTLAKMVGDGWGYTTLSLFLDYVRIHPHAALTPPCPFLSPTGRHVRCFGRQYSRRIWGSIIIALIPLPSATERIVHAGWARERGLRISARKNGGDENISSCRHVSRGTISIGRVNGAVPLDWWGEVCDRIVWVCICQGQRCVNGHVLKRGTCEMTAFFFGLTF